MKISKALYISLSLFNRKQRINLFFLALSQAIIGLLDLIGVSAFSAACVLLYRGQSGSKLLSTYFSWISIYSLESITIFLAILSPSLLLVKTLLSFILNRKTLNYLSKQQENISTRFFSETLTWPPKKLQEAARGRLEMILIDGTGGLCIGIIGYSMIAVSEFFLLLVLFLPIVFLTPFLTLLVLFAILCFFTIAFRKIGTFAQKAGQEYQESYFEIKDFIRVVGELSKEIWVKGSASVFAKKFESYSNRSSRALAQDFYIQQMPKYAMEITFLLLGTALVVSFASPGLGSTGKSVGLISFLMIAGMRIFPSYLRLQGALLVVRTNIGQTKMLLNEVEQNLIGSDVLLSNENEKQVSPPSIKIENISFSYPDGNEIIHELSLDIDPGEIIAITGPSGIGKSTLVDLILGIQQPVSGRILINNKSKRVFANYMSQHTSLIRGSLTENIVLGDSQIDMSEVVNVMKAVKLDSVFGEEKYPDDIYLDPRGSKLSGGEIQRIGLARTLYGNPTFIVLDEPTSSLDDESQKIISDVIERLSNTTILIIAHTAWPIKIADKILTFTGNGSIKIS